MSATADAATSASVLDLYEAGLAGEATDLWARRRDGSLARLPLHRWLGPLTAADEAVLARAVAPVLDVGCGPGRHVLALARRGVVALGIDISAAAVAYVLALGANAIEGSVFERIPNPGRWGSALLLDGNIGIGGRPTTLLRRLARAVDCGGTLLVELDGPGAPTRCEELRLESDGVASPWFPWARVGVDGIEEVAATAGLAVDEVWEGTGRWFAALSVS